LEDEMNAKKKREATADRQESFQAGFRGNSELSSLPSLAPHLFPQHPG